jgi:hypothetical protein
VICPISVRQDLERFHVTWSQDTEVAAIECGELRFVKPFDDREHSRVDEADVRVGVSIADLGHSPVIALSEVDDGVSATFDVPKQGDQHTGVEGSLNQVVDLDQDGSRNQQRLVCLFDQAPAASVVVVTPIE